MLSRFFAGLVLVFLVPIFVAVPACFGASSSDATSFREAPKLSDLIDREGLVVRLPLKEALRRYGLDKEVGRNNFYNEDLTDGSWRPRMKGFFHGTADGQGLKLKSLSKCVSLGHLRDRTAIYKSFRSRYGKPDHLSKGIPAYRVKHRGKYLLLSIHVIELPRDRTAVVYTVEDRTDRVMKKLIDAQRKWDNPVKARR